MKDQIAAAVVLDGDRFLLCLRSQARRWYPGVWDLPGGHIEHGETSADALTRELHEELGIQVHADEPVTRVVADDYDMDVFVVREWDGTVGNRAPGEHDEVSFFTLAEAARLPVVDGHLLPLLTRLVTASHPDGTGAQPPSPLVVASIPDASWLPPGGIAQAVVDPGGDAPAPTGLVRLLIRHGDDVFCVPREDTGKIDLPTRTVPHLDDGRSAAERLAKDVLGAPIDVTLVGFIRNVVSTPDEEYAWPTPIAHFSVWAASGTPSIDGRWISVSDEASPLRDRPWWPIAAHNNSR